MAKSKWYTVDVLTGTANEKLLIKAKDKKDVRKVISGAYDISIGNISKKGIKRLPRKQRLLVIKTSIAPEHKES